MRIAIVGAGFTGLALAYHLEKRGECQITFFDPKGIGGGASGIAAGLLHPFAGLHCKLNWKGREGMEATRKLLQVSAEKMEDSVYFNSGLIRPVLNEGNRKDYLLSSQRYPEDIEWLEADSVQKLLPQAACYPGVLIKDAITVYSDLYLKGLWLNCQNAKLIQTEIRSLEELKDFDRIILANGAAASKIQELSNLPISQVKGQILEISWPEGLPPLSTPMNSQAYIVMAPGNRTCYVGATYERDFKTSDPEPEVAMRELLPKAYAMIPALKEGKIIGCRAGIRASAPHHQPLLRQINQTTYVLTGMGSKGLLYHALFAKELAAGWC